jgi:hypothetical protein
MALVIDDPLGPTAKRAERASDVLLHSIALSHAELTEWRTAPNARRIFFCFVVQHASAKQQ